MNQLKTQGASNTLFDHSRPNKPNRSKFDLSRLNNFSLDPGMIVPFDCIPTLPDDEFRINVKLSLDTLPLIQSSLTGYKVVTHWYYIKSRDLWKGWKTFITKGRTGNVDLTVPQVDLNYPIDKPNGGSEVLSLTYGTLESDSSSNDIIYYGYHYPISRHSLSAFLGVPPFYSGYYNGYLVKDTEAGFVLFKDYLPNTFLPTSYDTSHNNGKDDPAADYTITAYQNKSSSPTSGIKGGNPLLTGFGNFSKVNALPFVAYQNIVKNNYVNQNYLYENTALFPEQGDDDWLLPYTVDSGNSNIANYISGRSEITKEDKINVSGVFSNDETDVDLRLLRYAMFDDDYFTTGLPWLQRGNVSDLSLDFSPNFESALKYVDVQLRDSNGNFHGGVDFAGSGSFPTDDSEIPVIMKSDGTDYIVETQDYGAGLSWGRIDGVHYLSLPLSNFVKSLNASSISGKFTANQLRSLVALSVWQERNAKTDGSYNATIFEHWSQNPKSEEHKPIYIGGTCDYINFSTVIQNSQSSDDSKLGDTAGFGSVVGSGDVGTFHCDDYGFIMGIMIVKPVTTYMQGVEHWTFETTFDDYVQPEFEALSPQAILNKEIYVSGTDEDNSLFAYQERYTYLKVRQNVNRGMFQVKPDKDILFGAFTQSRWFESRPKMSYQFLCMSPDNIRRDWLAYPVYPTFRVQCLSEVFAVRSLSYASRPNTFGF